MKFRNPVITVVGILAILSLAVSQAGASAMSSYQRGDYAAAKVEAEGELATNPSDIDTRHVYGLILNKTGNYELAAEQSRAVVAANPAHAEAWANLARALMELNRDQEALEAARKAADLRATSSNLHALARACFRLNDFTEARQAAEGAIAKDSKYYWAYNTLGLIMLKEGDNAGAVQQFETAASGDPGNSTFKSNLSAARAALAKGGTAAPAPAAPVVTEQKVTLESLVSESVIAPSGADPMVETTTVTEQTTTVIEQQPAPRIELAPPSAAQQQNPPPLPALDPPSFSGGADSGTSLPLLGN